MSDRATDLEWQELEDDPVLLEFLCPSTNILAWPAIRSDVIRLLVGDRLYARPLINLGSARSVPRILANGVRAAVRNRTARARSSAVLLVSTGAGLFPRDGWLFNRYADYFAEALGDSAWSVESLFGDAWPRGSRSNQRLTYAADDRLARALWSEVAVRKPHRTIAAQMIEVAATLGRERLGWEIGRDRRKALVATAARRLASYPIRARQARSLLRRVNPRLVLVEEGCYGHMAVFNAVARESGVRVAEFQHGLVTRAHDAYNVGPRLAMSDAYRRTLPSIFLGYGAWWNGQFNAPVDARIVIGNPHRSEVLQAWQPNRDRRNVIVLGDGADTEVTQDFAAELSRTLGSSYQVLFRPHPLERAVAGSRPNTTTPVDATADLYQSLAHAHAVVGEVSTALFEAAGLVDRVVAWDTAKSRFYLGDHPFERATGPKELSDLLAGPPMSGVPDASEIWADQWKRRFTSFLDSALA